MLINLLSISKDLLKIQNLKFTDNNNILELSTAYVNTKTNNLFGKDVSVKLDNKTLNKKNEPRLKGNSLKNNETQIIKEYLQHAKKRWLSTMGIKMKNFT